MWALRLWLSLALAMAQTDSNPPSLNITPSFFVNEIFEKYGDRNVLTYEGFEHLLESLGLGRVSFEETHDVSLHKINGSFLDIHDELVLHKHSHGNDQSRRRRHLQEPPHRGDEGESEEHCLTTQDILASYGLQLDHQLVISQEGFQAICPAIVYELDQKHCFNQHYHHELPERSTSQVWLEASLSILIMSVAGLLCAAVVPILTRSKGGELLNFLVAVAAGTLAGDAMIHLLPQALHYDQGMEDDDTPLLRAVVALSAVILLYVIESVLRLIQIKKQGKSAKDSPEEHGMLHHGHSHGAGSGGTGPLACVVIAGDILHNVTDGLSVGAAFSVSRGAGLACATAVFCHELPHELGDYAVLLKEGMGVRRALLCNLFSSLFSFMGMALGLLLAEVFHAAPWVNAFTAGSFLYIALANLVPELKTSNSIGALLAQVLGLTSGVLLMLCIGLYEHDWEYFLTS